MTMAFASAATLSPMTGAITGFWSSLFILMSDSKYGIISTSMAVALLSKPIIETYGEDAYHIALFLSAILLIILIVTKMYMFLIIVPKCVLDGFMAGCVLSIFSE